MSELVGTFSRSRNYLLCSGPSNLLICLRRRIVPVLHRTMVQQVELTSTGCKENQNSKAMSYMKDIINFFPA